MFLRGNDALHTLIKWVAQEHGVGDYGLPSEEETFRNGQRRTVLHLAELTGTTLTLVEGEVHASTTPEPSGDRELQEQVRRIKAAAAGKDPEPAPATPPTPDLDDPIHKHIELSPKAESALANHGITKLRDLRGFSGSELLAIRNFGEGSLNDLRRQLAALNLSLKPSPTEQ